MNVIIKNYRNKEAFSLSTGNVNPDFCKGSVAVNNNINKMGFITGCYLDNAKKFPRFKVTLSDGSSTDWNLENCTVISSNNNYKA